MKQKYRKKTVESTLLFNEIEVANKTTVL